MNQPFCENLAKPCQTAGRRPRRNVPEPPAWPGYENGRLTQKNGSFLKPHARLPDPRDCRRQARHHLYRHEEPSGTALQQRHPIPSETPRPAAARRLHEGAQQLPVPVEALRGREKTHPQRARRDRRLPHDPRVGPHDRDRRPRRAQATPQRPRRGAPNSSPEREPRETDAH